MFNKVVKYTGAGFCVVMVALYVLSLLGVFQLSSDLDEALWQLGTTGLLLYVLGAFFEIRDRYNKFEREAVNKYFAMRKILLDLDSKKADPFIHEHIPVKPEKDDFKKEPPTGYWDAPSTKRIAP